MKPTIRRVLNGNFPFYLAALLSLLGGLVRTKVVAEGIGVSGSGYIGQLSTAVAVLGLIAFLSMWGVSARDLSADITEDGIPNRTISLLIVIVVGNGILSFLILILALAGVNSELIALNSWGFVGLVLLATASAWMNAAMVWWRVHRNVGSCLIATILANTVSIGLSWYGGEADDIRYVELGLFCTFAIPALIFVFGSVLPFLLDQWGDIQFSGGIVSRQIRDGAYSMSASLSRVGADLASRSLVVASLGAVGNGLIQPYYVYSGVLITQFISIAQTSIIGDAVRRDNRLMLQRIAYVLLGLGLGALSVTLAGNVILEVLFSSKFSDAYPSFAAGAWAEVGRWVCIIASGILLVYGKVRLVAVLGVAGAIVRISVVLFGADSAGLMVVPYSVLAETILVSAIFLAFARKELDRGVLNMILLASLLSFIGVFTVGGLSN